MLARRACKWRTLVLCVAACVVVYLCTQSWEAQQTIKCLFGGRDKRDTPFRDTRERKTVPKVLQSLINDVAELEGRHADFVQPPCQETNSVPSAERMEKFGFLGPFPYLNKYKNPCWYPEGSKQLRCVPYFYMIGSNKCGSMEMISKLQAHPKIAATIRKDWFSIRRFNVSDDEAYSFSDYLDLFKEGTNRVEREVDISGFHDVVLGDVSTDNVRRTPHWRELVGNEGCEEPRVLTISHIHHLWSGAKLIMTLRNPVERQFSAYLFNQPKKPGFKGTPAQFDLWIRNWMEVWNSCLRKNSFRNCLYSDDNNGNLSSPLEPSKMGCYSRNIIDVLKIFPRKQIFFIELGSYSKNRKETLRSLYEFLELPPLSERELDKISTEKKRNEGKRHKKTEMWSSTRKLLEEFYAPCNAELWAMMDWDPLW